ncbi:Putative 3-oxopropanoate dehydrogenase [Paraburkholderia rhynchosiae]|uniref:3-oxopropanoate dehydrogenase n=1 Tax=Paraburkholderia rhynchosiae TaxID=487049 RepID=A0A6J5ASH9_9BURK|nr:Putative 3-oxopropanoate dehydrogenase [Paraburkholderia rhynchosiae]
MQAFNDTTDVAHFIPGEVVRGSGQRTQPIFNPATGERPRQLLLGEVADVGTAVASAKAAFPKWSNTPPIRRARVCC